MMSCMTYMGAAPGWVMPSPGPAARKVAAAVLVATAAYRCDAMPMEPAPAWRFDLHDTPTTPHPIGPLPPLPKVAP